MVVTRSVLVQISGNACSNACGNACGNACSNACGNALENHSEFVLKKVLKFFGIQVYYANICFVNIENDFIILLH